MFMSKGDKRELEEYRKAAVLIDIRSEGRTLILEFLKDGKTFTIEAYSSHADNVAMWRVQAGLD